MAIRHTMPTQAQLQRPFPAAEWSKAHPDFGLFEQGYEHSKIPRYYYPHRGWRGRWYKRLRYVAVYLVDYLFGAYVEYNTPPPPVRPKQARHSSHFLRDRGT